jgi:ribose-phosphate pyrophosphokinase
MVDRPSGPADLVVIGGSSHRALARDVAGLLDVPNVPVRMERYPDGEIAGCVRALLDAGARPDIGVLATHGLFLPGSFELLSDPAIVRVWVTDTLPQSVSPAMRRIVVPVAPLLADAIARTCGRPTPSQS